MSFVEYYLVLTTSISVVTILSLLQRLIRSHFETSNDSQSVLENEQQSTEWDNNALERTLKANQNEIIKEVLLKCQEAMKIEIGKRLQHFNNISSENTLSRMHSSDRHYMIDYGDNDNVSSEEKFITVEKRISDLEGIIREKDDSANNNSPEKSRANVRIDNLENKVKLLNDKLSCNHMDQIKSTIHLQNEIEISNEHIRNHKNSIDQITNEKCHIVQSNINLTREIQNLRLALTKSEDDIKYINTSTTDLRTKYKSLKLRLTNFENNTTKSNQKLDFKYQSLKIQVKQKDNEMRQEVQTMMLRPSPYFRHIASTVTYPDVSHGINPQFSAERDGGRPFFKVNNAENEATFGSIPPPIPPPLPVNNTGNEAFDLASTSGSCQLDDGQESSLTKVYERVPVTREMLKSVKLKPPSKEPRPEIKPRQKTDK